MYNPYNTSCPQGGSSIPSNLDGMSKGIYHNKLSPHHHHRDHRYHHFDHSHQLL
eukprot:Gb_06652 [translate_table: standard]